MGTAYMMTSGCCFLLETILQLYVVATHSKGSEALFVILLALVMGPLILINFISAIQVTRTQDFSGKGCGRAVCIGFHSFQLGLVWRTLKLLILFDSKDWDDYLNMRLFHCGFQSLPFSVILAYSMFVSENVEAASVVTIVVSLSSAAVALTTYRTGDKLYEAVEFENTRLKIRKNIGVVFLAISTFLVLLSRCSSIVLFTVVLPVWIVLPLALRFLVNVIVRLCRLKCDTENTLSQTLKIIYLSFVSMFEMVGKEYKGVKCSYVLFYSTVLIENLIMSFYWMLSANYGERFKLMTVVVILMSFIIGVIVKFASCGCIYNIESDILSDAFNNPELKTITDKGIEVTTPISRSHVKNAPEMQNNEFHEIHIETDQINHLPSPVIASTSRVKRSKTSRNGSSSTSSNTAAHRRDYDNFAFIQSQGNISLDTPHSLHNRQSSNSQIESKESHKHSMDGHKRSRDRIKRLRDNSDHLNLSHESNTISSGSHKRSKDGRGKGSHHSHNRSKGSYEHSHDTHTRSHDSQNCSRDSHKRSHNSQERLRAKNRNIPEKPSKVNRPMLIVSDTSKHENMDPQAIHNTRRKIKGSNADLASSNSKYSRNTNTLNGSVQNYHYNGFNDPYRERRLLENGKNNRTDHSRRHKRYRSRGYSSSIYSNLDYSLDSSELYPSMSSDTSSMTSYENTQNYVRNKPRHRAHTRHRHNYDSRDGYSTDVSNSDYLSFNDYSMGDSSSWTESSESDGALTWPPSHTSNLLNMYNIPENVSSKDNVMHWLDTMEIEDSVHDTSFSTLHEPSVASETDISLSAMQTFEVKKERKRFKRLIPKPKGVLLKFCSLNYKGKQKHLRDRPYPLNQSTQKTKYAYETKVAGTSPVNMHLSNNPDVDGRVSLPTMPLPIDSVQESIV